MGLLSNLDIQEVATSHEDSWASRNEGKTYFGCCIMLIKEKINFHFKRLIRELFYVPYLEQLHVAE